MADAQRDAGERKPERGPVVEQGCSSSSLRCSP